MKVTIEISKAIECDFEQDRFKDFFERAIRDMNLLCGNYEREIAEELEKAFQNAEMIS